MFETRVIKLDSIDPVLKLQHLISCLEGKAAQRLHNLKIIGANLNVAWDILTRRYDNKKVRLHPQLYRMISAPSVDPKTTGELTRLLDTFEESIRALSIQGRSKNTWDDWFVHLLVSKLDPTTRQDWEKSLETHNQYATYEELASFLENRARTLQNTQTQNNIYEAPSQKTEFTKRVGPPNSQPSSKWVNSHSANTTLTELKTVTECAHCKEQHSISKCRSCTQLQPDERLEFVKKESLCINCLKKISSSGHLSFYI